MSLLKPFTGIGFECTLVTGSHACRLYKTATDVLEATFDVPGCKDVTQHLALVVRLNPAARNEVCIFYSPDVNDPIPTNDEMLRFFSDGSDTYKVVAKQYFARLVAEKGFHYMQIAHNVRRVNEG